MQQIKPESVEFRKEMEESQDRKATRRRIYMTEVTDVVSVWPEHTELKKRTKTPFALLSQW